MRPRLTYSNVVSTLCLFLLLAGGTAYALDGSNTVFSDDIVNGEIKTGDIGALEVKAADVAADSLGSAKIADGSVRNADLSTGASSSNTIADGGIQAVDLAPGASEARAWGLVSTVGTLLRSKHVTSVTNPDDGVYCIDPAPGIDPATSVMIVGNDFGAENSTSVVNDDFSHVEWVSDAAGCPRGTMRVNTFLGVGQPSTSGEIDEGGFQLVTLSQGFTFVIP